MNIIILLQGSNPSRTFFLHQDRVPHAVAHHQVVHLRHPPELPGRPRPVDPARTRSREAGQHRRRGPAEPVHGRDSARPSSSLGSSPSGRNHALIGHPGALPHVLEVPPHRHQDPPHPARARRGVPFPSAADRGLERPLGFSTSSSRSGVFVNDGTMGG